MERAKISDIKKAKNTNRHLITIITYSFQIYVEKEERDIHFSIRGAQRMPNKRTEIESASALERYREQSGKVIKKERSCEKFARQFQRDMTA